MPGLAPGWVGIGAVQQASAGSATELLAQWHGSRKGCRVEKKADVKIARDS